MGSKSMWKHIRPKGIGRFERKSPNGGSWEPTTIRMIELSMGGGETSRLLRSGHVLTSERGWKYRYVSPETPPSSGDGGSASPARGQGGMDRTA